MLTISDIRFRRTFAAAAAGLALAAVSAGCDGDDDLAEPDVQTIRLVVGTGAAAVTYNIDVGAGLAGNIVIERTATPVAATFLRANGDVEPLVNATEFELRIEQLNTSIATFTRTGAFTGTLTGVAVGTDEVVVQLWHKGDNHDDASVGVTLQVN